MNIVFTFLMLSGIIFFAINGNIDSVAQVAMMSASSAVERVIALVGMICLWLGVAKIAEKSGLIEVLSNAIHPFVRFLFPSVPEGHPAMGAMLMNMGANILGFGNAATPFGLKAMAELQKLNDKPDTASEAMCTFLAINTSSVTLIPTTIIGLRAASGSRNPTEVIGLIIFATTCSTLVAVIADFIFRKLYRLGNGIIP
ncbi:MAG TPA: spore maturation protein [Thermoanaerobacterales bacterium]|nr:spore maturation protein [Thermoanaerobacterales bacterium]